MKKSYWKLNITHMIPSQNPSFPGHKYRTNDMVGIIADTAESAIERVKKEYDECRVISVNHQGEVDFIN